MDFSLSAAIQLKPIGVVEKGVPRPEEKDAVLAESRFDIVSVVRIFDSYADGLKGLEEYSHAFIIYFMHEVGRFELLLETPQTGSLGVFATRSPHRPNPIGLTLVEIVSVEVPILKVRGLDAWTGTPVLDIKPYDYYDIVKNPRVPRWFEERWREVSARKRYREKVPWLGPY